MTKVKILISPSGRACHGSVSSNLRLQFYRHDNSRFLCEVPAQSFISSVSRLLSTSQLKRIVETDRLGLFSVDENKLKLFIENCNN